MQMWTRLSICNVRNFTHTQVFNIICVEPEKYVADLICEGNVKEPTWKLQKNVSQERSLFY